MVEDTRRAPGADTFKSVNLPEPVRVVEANGVPAAINGKERQPVAAINDRWRIDDEWWRDEEVSRLYFAVMLTSGQRMVLYKDLVKGGWYKQGE